MSVLQVVRFVIVAGQKDWTEIWLGVFIVSSLSELENVHLVMPLTTHILMLHQN